MAIAGLRKRLNRLVGRRVDPEHCDGGVTLTLFYDESEPEPEIPPDAPRCWQCGQPHVMLVEIAVVDVAGEAVRRGGLQQE